MRAGNLDASLRALAKCTRCPLHTLPHITKSIYGCAHILVSLVFKAQRDLTSARNHLSDARRYHKIFDGYIAAGKKDGSELKTFLHEMSLTPDHVAGLQSLIETMPVPDNVGSVPSSRSATPSRRALEAPPPTYPAPVLVAKNVEAVPVVKAGASDVGGPATSELAFFNSASRAAVLREESLTPHGLTPRAVFQSQGLTPPQLEIPVVASGRNTPGQAVARSREPILPTVSLFSRSRSQSRGVSPARGRILTNPGPSNANSRGSSLSRIRAAAPAVVGDVGQAQVAIVSAVPVGPKSNPMTTNLLGGVGSGLSAPSISGLAPLALPATQKNSTPYHLPGSSSTSRSGSKHQAAAAGGSGTGIEDASLASGSASFGRAVVAAISREPELVSGSPASSVSQRQSPTQSFPPDRKPMEGSLRREDIEQQAGLGGPSGSYTLVPMAGADTSVAEEFSTREPCRQGSRRVWSSQPVRNASPSAPGTAPALNANAAGRGGLADERSESTAVSRKQQSAEHGAAANNQRRPEVQLGFRFVIQHDELEYGSRLGSGGFGTVYHGVYRGQEVAIKKINIDEFGNMSETQIQEMEKEIAALSQLKHPRLVKFIGACLEYPHLSIITEFMPGGSLHALLHINKVRLPYDTQMKIAMQFVEGVRFLHTRQPSPIVHRDLKSLNLVLDRMLNCKICDFGLTRTMDKTHLSVKDGGNGGSPRYMAPECYESAGKLTEKVDVWAAGCILNEIFGGSLPFDECNAIQQIVKKLLVDRQGPVIPSHISAPIQALIRDCLQFEPPQRLPAEAIYKRLEQIARG
ncbi:unnamed protein product [Amoebophrya sp. A25]|nr:unnamed protein product [Amoebophrya sp. A25]|eukprot:GSA25T00023686001.1